MDRCSETLLAHLAAEAYLAALLQVQRWWQRPTQTRRSVSSQVAEARSRSWSTVRWIRGRLPALIQVRWVHWWLLAALRRALQADQCTSCVLLRDCQHRPATAPLLHAVKNLTTKRPPVCCTPSFSCHAASFNDLCCDLPAETGLLRFNWGNICMHYFSVPFLVRMAQQLQQQGRYHIAHKTIPSKDGPVKVAVRGRAPLTFPRQLAASNLQLHKHADPTRG